MKGKRDEDEREVLGNNWKRRRRRRREYLEKNSP